MGLSPSDAPALPERRQRHGIGPRRPYLALVREDAPLAAAVREATGEAVELAWCVCMSSSDVVSS